MASIEANWIALAYESFGNDDAETILLIAGLGTQMIRWPLPFCACLADSGYRVIRFDNRDAGCSTHFTDSPAPDFAALAAALAAGQGPRVPYTLHDMADDAIGLLDALGIAHAHLVGRSMGGMIAQIATSKYPGRIRSLTSIMSSTGNPALPPASPEVMDKLTRPAPDPLVDEAAYLEHSLAFARLIASPAYPFDEPAQRALVLEEARRAHDPGGFARQVAAIGATGDLRPLLARIAVPALVVHGADDLLVPPACGRDTALSIPGAECMLIEGMGHDLPAALYRMVADGIVRTARRSALSSGR